MRVVAGVQDMLTSYPNCGRLGLKVRVPKGLTQVQMTRLFNIVPTLEYCRLVTNQYSVTGLLHHLVSLTAASQCPCCLRLIISTDLTSIQIAMTSRRL